MIGRIQRPLDFERVLGRPACARSVHFTVHHCLGVPSPVAMGRRAHSKVAMVGAHLAGTPAKLSTTQVQGQPQAVDDSADGIWLNRSEASAWLGLVVPKRNARRAVTRQLIKRQIRSVWSAQQAPQGLWVVRLRAPIDKKHFPSASSLPLAQALREELSSVLDRAFTRVGTDLPTAQALTAVAPAAADTFTAVGREVAP